MRNGNINGASVYFDQFAISWNIYTTYTRYHLHLTYCRHDVEKILFFPLYDKLNQTKGYKVKQGFWYKSVLGVKNIVLASLLVVALPSTSYFY